MALDLMAYTADSGADLMASYLGMSLGALIFIAAIILLLKGFALYKAARLKQKWWFWLMLIFNTAGLLPAIYLIIHRNKKA